jgi:uncharacterized membrane protein YkgB
MKDNFFSKINTTRLSAEHSFFSFLRRISLPLSKVAFFVVFFWFGVLKMLELSPAEGVVHTLYQHTVPFIPWKMFIMAFGAYECLIGIVFLFPGKEKWALYMLIPHMITTFGPLVLVPNLTWKGFLVPNLIGQYIIKNVVIIALAIFISASVAEEEEKKKSHAIPKERKIKIA